MKSVLGGAMVLILSQAYYYNDVLLRSISSADEAQILTPFIPGRMLYATTPPSVLFYSAMVEG